MIGKKIALSATIAILVVFQAKAEDLLKESVAALLEKYSLINSSISLKEAMALVASKKTGWITTARIESHDHQTVYEIELLHERKVYCFHVDALTASFVNKKLNLAETAYNYLDATGQISSIKFAAPIHNQNLLKAIGKIGGDLLSIRASEEDHGLFYTVHSAANGHIIKYIVSTENGNIVFFRKYRENEQD